MTRTAVVTGGTRGIGKAIAIALKNAGYNVAANYGSDDAAAQQFQNETGIPVFKFNVGDFQACIDGIAAIEAQLGPVEVLVNNAGITPTPRCTA
jgi:acetoacetyl-CoA reductase